MKYAEFMGLKRGDYIGDDRVLWVHDARGGGVGMGQYPSTRTVVFQSGRVWSADDWDGKITVVEKGL